MNFLTHIMISKTLYRQLSRKMCLDQKAFAYGNIKPDISPQCLRNPHILENYLFVVYHDSNQLIGENPSAKEFSIALGVICHYICDFFCYSHLNNNIYHKLISHFFYELRLHFAFCFLKINLKINGKTLQRFSGKTIASMIMEMRKEYAAKKNTLQKDIEYAIMTCLLACEMIIRPSNSTSELPAAVNSAYPKAFYNPSRV